MMDFLKIYARPTKRGVEVYPVFVVKTSRDLMVRGRDFYAVWNEETGLWSKDENDLMAYVDSKVQEEVEKQKAMNEGSVYGLYMWNSDSGIIDKWHRYVQHQMRDHYHALDEKVIFADQKTKKTDYASHKLPYSMAKGSIASYDEIMSTLYKPEEREKIEWAIGSVIAGDSKNIQKFIVLYGSAGTGKSTVLKIIAKLFEGYTSEFKAKDITNANNAFALEPFKSNPLISFDHEGKLDKIADNTTLNSIVSHDKMVVNEKFKSMYTTRFNTFLFIGTNTPVKITEAKSGLVRRLIDVQPTGEKIPYSKYMKLMKQLDYELGAIAQHCLDVYMERGEDYYENYVPVEMISATNDVYDFIEFNFEDFFLKYSEVTLRDIYDEYKSYVEYAKVVYPMNMRELGVEMRNYYETYRTEGRLDGRHVRNLYSGFIKDKFMSKKKTLERREEPKEVPSWLIFKEQESLFDKTHEDCFAQLARDTGEPQYKWENVKTRLKDIDTSKLHYVNVQSEQTHEIVMDFDLKDENGNKSFEKNLEAASQFPPTYAELSKSGAGIHLHYIYTGDLSELDKIYSEDIEVKIFTGNSSLRRKLVKCNDIPIATISGGLPKKPKKMVNNTELKTEAGIIARIGACLRKEHHGATAPEVSYIKKTLDDAYNSGMTYDVRLLYNDVLAFANNSSHQKDKCFKDVMSMHFCSDDILKNEEVEEVNNQEADESRLVFYDIEVYPNLFLICWKFIDADGKQNKVVRMYNPTAKEVRSILGYDLAGFNNRRYDNHIIYSRVHGYSIPELYKQSQRIIEGDKNAMQGGAYNLSYTDVYDFCSKKQSLKKWEIELKIPHKEMDIRWDKPVPEELWQKVGDYCENDVRATEAVFKANQGDWVARKILADLAGMSVNSTTNSLTTKIIFGDEKKPNLVYTDFRTGKQTDMHGNDVTNPNIINKFDGYDYVYSDADKKYHNMYRGVDLGHGGYVYAEPGQYYDVALLDVQSMHPNSVRNLNAFNDFTKNFTDLVDIRVDIKHGDYEDARKMFNGKLTKYLGDKSTAKSLAQALKIAINSVYGLTSAKFTNAFTDPRNKNNIVALRGALFMKTLQDEVAARGFTVAHIKTDSIKIPNATPEIIQFVMDFGKKYGYTFEHEATYRRMCLVNDAVYIAQYSDDELNGDHRNQWTATGAQFQVPYVFKTLFSKEKIEFDDLCETKSVSSALYLDYNENLPNVEAEEKELKKLTKKLLDPSVESKDEIESRIAELEPIIRAGHNYKFIGKVGLFTPVVSGSGGGILLRETKENEYSAANDSKGYRWMESDVVKNLHLEDKVDHNYYHSLVNGAIDAISQYGDFYAFVSDYPIDINDNRPTF